MGLLGLYIRERMRFNMLLGVPTHALYARCASAPPVLLRNCTAALNKYNLYK